MIPFVRFNTTSRTIYLYESPDAPPPATFEMDPEQARELIAMLVGSIVGIEDEPDRIALLFQELLTRARKQRHSPRAPVRASVVNVAHEDFLRDLYALCQNHGVHLDGTEDDGVMVVPNDVDMDLGDDDGLVHPDRFAFFQCDGDGSMRCHPGKPNGRGDVDPDYDADALRLPSRESARDV